MKKRTWNLELRTLIQKAKFRAHFFQAPSSKLKTHQGFTLVELLVVCAIMVVVGAIIFASNNKFGGQVLLQNLAYDVALSVRQAQVYGISVQRFNGAFNYAYGMHFDTSTPTAYNLFADVNANGLYAAGEDVAPSPYSIGRAYSILRLCAPAGSDLACTGGTVVTKLDIVFIRPEPDAWISSGSVSCVPRTGTNCRASSRVVLQSPRGDKMSLKVFANGQIAVDQVAAIAQ